MANLNKNVLKIKGKLIKYVFNCYYFKFRKKGFIKVSLVSIHLLVYSNLIYKIKIIKKIKRLNFNFYKVHSIVSKFIILIIHSNEII